jgi:hypothetical protein
MGMPIALDAATNAEQIPSPTPEDTPMPDTRRLFLYTATYDHLGTPRTLRRTSPHLYTHAVLLYRTRDPQTHRPLRQPTYDSPRLVALAPEDVARVRRRLPRGAQLVPLVSYCETLPMARP